MSLPLLRLVKDEALTKRKLPNETDLLEMVRRLVTYQGAHVQQGIGDDAAVLKPSTARQVYSIDSAVEGVHFKRHWLTPKELAYRSFAAAVSDLSAMGARPRGFLCHLSLPQDTTRQQMTRFFEEQQRLAFGRLVVNKPRLVILVSLLPYSNIILLVVFAINS